MFIVARRKFNEEPPEKSTYVVQWNMESSGQRGKLCFDSGKGS